MSYSRMRTMQQSTDTGLLRINVESALRNTPCRECRGRHFLPGDPESVIEEVRTDSTGRTDTVALEAPPLEYSLSPGEQQPYPSIRFPYRRRALETITVSGSEILSGQLSCRQSDCAICRRARRLPRATPLQQIIMCVTGITSRMWPPAKFILPGRTAAIRAKCAGDHVVYLNRVYTEWYRNKGFNFLRSPPPPPSTTNGFTDEIFLRAFLRWWMSFLPIIYPPERQTADPDAVL